MMKRQDRQKDEAFAREVLRDCEYATLATVNPDGTPYSVPVSPVVMEDTVYFHCAMNGKKLDNMKQNPNVCISGVRHTKLIPEKFTTEFESAVALGSCQWVTDEAEKIEALRLICEKYAASNMGRFDAAIKASLHRTCVCKIVISEVTGKAKIYPKK